LFSPSVSHLAGAGQPIAAILDPSFQLLGDIQIDLAQVKTTKFRLNGVQFSAPIDGTMSVELRCYADSAGSVEHRGFLNMYEEVSGLGSWMRYWCVLMNGAIKLYRYPDDEPKKEPIAVIDLTRCIHSSVRSVTREECARAYTFRLDVQADTRQQQQKPIADTFKVVVSCDLADEYSVWTQRINDTLHNLHMWNPMMVGSSARNGSAGEVQLRQNGDTVV